MNSLKLSLHQAHVVLSRSRQDALLIVHTTPRVGSSAFMRQLSRNPMLRAAKEEEAERRRVKDSAQTFSVLQRHGLRLSALQRDQVKAFFGENDRATF